MDDERIEPAPGAPASHWGTKDPEHQPTRDAVLGLKRLVIESRTRLGPAATADTVAADLRERGVTADPAEVARCLAEPY